MCAIYFTYKHFDEKNEVQAGVQVHVLQINVCCVIFSSIYADAFMYSLIQPGYILFSSHPFANFSTEISDNLV